MSGSQNIRKGSTHTIRIGPAGWSYADWAGIVYPGRKPAAFHEAAYLSEFFDTIEINTSFYQPLRPGQTVEYIITDSDNRVPNDRVRAYALWDGWFGYDRRKYTELLHDAFDPLALVPCEQLPSSKRRAARKDR